ncbi:MAG: type IV pilus modification PilV family protein [Opitutaceae bacterium]
MAFIRPSGKAGFSLIEMIIGMFVMSLVITGGLLGLGQANLLSEKANKQSIADFLLRVETERIRGMSWSELEALSTRIASYEKTNANKSYSVMQSISTDDLSKVGLEAALRTADMTAWNARGKKVFHLSLNWDDQTGREHVETRVIVITEGGFSASS